MSKYEDGVKLLEEKFGNGKDNMISLATVARQGVNGKPRPVVRDVDAYYEDGVFYVTTYSRSNKMLQIAENPEVAVAVCGEWFTAVGTGENLGWVLKPENAEMRTKLRKAFAAWYDSANHEDDEGCCILAIRLSRGTLNINHWEKLYHMDFTNKILMENAGIS